MLKGNKGEWSELYVLLKLISEGKVYGADKDLNQIDDIYYDILKMIRNQTDKVWEYERESNISIKIIDQETNEVVITLPISDFIKSIKIDKLKAKSIDKADVFIKIHDYKTGSKPTLGFSIKSMLGNPSTLLNAGKTTNFLYKLNGKMSDDIMNSFNSFYKLRGSKKISDFRTRFNFLEKKNIDLEYLNVCNSTFNNNLILIDSLLPQICGYLVKRFYTTGNSNCMNALKDINDVNPLGFDINGGQPFYHYKFKKLISESALGMLPGKTWNGIAHATGGYLIVKEDGDVLCYHLYNRNAFEDYLLDNTKFDTPSTSKYDFGYIYKEGHEYFIKLCMQVRFIK